MKGSYNLEYLGVYGKVLKCIVNKQAVKSRTGPISDESSDLWFHTR
jgi:hypothetical protein